MAEQFNVPVFPPDSWPNAFALLATICRDGKTLVLCGSASSWIEYNILEHTAFVGRISHMLTLDELPLPVCDAFWGKRSKPVSAAEKFKFLAVTGGVPRYLEELDPKVPVKALVHGSKSFSEICKAIGKEPNGVITGYLEELELSGFLTRDYAYSPKSGKMAKNPRYRIRDNYLRFYLRYIEPRRDKIIEGAEGGRYNLWPAI